MGQDNLQDTRVHVMLYFVLGQIIPTQDLIYIKKLSKFVNVIPVLIQSNDIIEYNFEHIKLNAKKQLRDNSIEWFDLQEDDLTFRQFQKQLLAKTTPFLLSVNKNKIDTTHAYTDTFILCKMLMTPYINTYYYKTELLF